MTRWSMSENGQILLAPLRAQPRGFEPVLRGKPPYGFLGRTLTVRHPAAAWCSPSFFAKFGSVETVIDAR